MTDKFKVQERIDRGDGSVAPHHASVGAKTIVPPLAPGEGKVEPHDRESEVITTFNNEKLICPQCGKTTIHIEFPDHYEAWVKCSNCRFFMGMSNEEWHRMENSKNLNKDIKTMAIDKELVKPVP